MDQQIKKNMDRYGVTEHEAEIMVDRGKVYGDPVENHEFIAMQITGLLSPWAHRIAMGMPLPPHVIALILCALKMSRMRRVFHEDNYDDLSVYQKFARAWQREWSAEKSEFFETPVIAPMVVDLKEKPKDSLEGLKKLRDVVDDLIAQEETSNAT